MESARVLCFLGFILQVSADPCSTGEEKSLSENTDLFIVDIDGPTNANNDYVALTGTPVQFSAGTQVEIYRNAGVFRLMSLFFTADHTSTVSVSFRNSMGTEIGGGEFDIGGQRFIAIHRQGDPPSLANVEVPLLPPNGLAGVKTVVIILTQGDSFTANQPVFLYNLQMYVCVSSGPPFNPNLPIKYNGNVGSEGAGRDILTAFLNLCTKYVDRLRARFPDSFTAIAIQKDIVRTLVAVFSSENSEYIFRDKPEGFGSQVRWLGPKNLEAMDAVKAVQVELRKLQVLSLTEDMSQGDRNQAVRTTEQLKTALLVMKEQLLETNLLFLSNTDLSPVTPFLSPVCTDQSDCSEQRQCCFCRCHRPADCRKIQAQEDLRSCIDLTIESPYSALPAILEDVCVLIDALKGGVNPSLGRFLDNQKLAIKAALGPFPGTGSPLPGKPGLNDNLSLITDWLIKESREIQCRISKTFVELGKIRTTVLESLSERERTDLAAEIGALFAGLRSLCDGMHQLDRALLTATGCYITYALETSVDSTPVPQ